MNKNIFVVGLIVSLGFPALGEEPVSNSDFFRTQKTAAYTQGILGSAELVLGTLMASSALRGVRSTVRSTTTSDAMTNAANAIKNSKDRLKALQNFTKSNGGLFRTVKFLGASILLIDAAGRTYEWFGTDAEPNWSPVYSYLTAQAPVPLENIPESSTKENTEVPAIGQPVSAADQTLEKQLREKLEGRLAKLNPNYKAEIEAEMATLQGRIAQQTAQAQPTPESQGDHSSSISTSDFFKTRPASAGSQQFAQAVLFGGDLLGAKLLLSNLMTNEGLSAIRAAEDAVAKVKALTPVSGSVANMRGAIPRANGVPRLNAATALEKAASELEVKAHLAAREGFKDAAEIALKRVAKLREAAIALKTSSAVSKSTHAQLTAMAENQLAEARALALRTSRKTSSLFKGIKVVGSMVLIGDAIGRVYQWNAASGEPQFSPAMTWLMVNTEKPVEDMWEGIGKLSEQGAELATEVSKDSYDYLMEQYRKRRAQ